MGDTHAAALPKHTSTQQHVAPKPKFIITGFGRFCGVAQNPTEQLVNWLQQRSCQTTTAAAAPAGKEEQQPYCISSLDVLEVSADAVDAFMQKQQQLLIQHASQPPSSLDGPQPVVLLHFGVDTQVGVVDILDCCWFCLLQYLAWGQITTCLACMSFTTS